MNKLFSEILPDSYDLAIYKLDHHIYEIYEHQRYYVKKIHSKPT